MVVTGFDTPCGAANIHLRHEPLTSEEIERLADPHKDGDRTTKWPNRAGNLDFAAPQPY